MALTLSTPTRRVVGNRVEVRLAATFDSSYATGGEAFSAAAACGLNVVEHVEAAPFGGFIPEYVPSTGKIKLYWVDTSVDGAALAEVASTTDVATVVIPLVVTGY